MLPYHGIIDVNTNSMSDIKYVMPTVDWYQPVACCLLSVPFQVSLSGGYKIGTCPLRFWPPWCPTGKIKWEKMRVTQLIQTGRLSATFFFVSAQKCAGIFSPCHFRVPFMLFVTLTVCVVCTFPKYISPTRTRYLICAACADTIWIYADGTICPNKKYDNTNDTNDINILMSTVNWYQLVVSPFSPFQVSLSGGWKSVHVYWAPGFRGAGLEESQNWGKWSDVTDWNWLTVSNTLSCACTKNMLVYFLHITFVCHLCCLQLHIPVCVVCTILR